RERRPVDLARRPRRSARRARLGRRARDSSADVQVLEKARILAVTSHPERLRHQLAKYGGNVVPVLLGTHAVRRFGLSEDILDDITGGLQCALAAAGDIDTELLVDPSK